MELRVGSNTCVLAHAEEGAILHCVVLVSGRDDSPGQSGQVYRLCMDFWMLTNIYWWMDVLRRTYGIL